jgi:hypothetical protein
MIFRVDNVDIYEKSEIIQKVSSQFSKDRDFNNPHVDEIFKRYPEKAKQFLKTVSLNDYIAFDSDTGEIVMLEHINTGLMYINLGYLSHLNRTKPDDVYCKSSDKEPDILSDGTINHDPYYKTIFNVKYSGEEKTVFEVKYKNSFDPSSFNKNDHNLKVNVFWENLPKWTSRADKISFILDEDE